MPIARLTPESTCLLVIDVQQRLIDTMIDADRLIERCRFLVQCAGVLELPVAVTEQYVKGLGHTVSAVTDVLPVDTPVFEKTRFSGCVDGVRNWLDGVGRRHVLLCGIEAQVCVLQTGLDLLASGRLVFAVLDAISGGEADQIAPAVARLQGAGAVVTGCTSVIYELLRDAGDPRFHECLPLIKTLRSGK